jgi:bifunctional ADP-heptose synthase (sugar kinase/adenylyltransferase)
MTRYLGKLKQRLKREPKQGSVYNIDQVLGDEGGLLDWLKYNLFRNNVVLTSGPGDLIHGGHLAQYDQAKRLAGRRGKHITLTNSDRFLDEKKGFHTQDYQSRANLLNHIKTIDEVVPVIDGDQTVCQTLVQQREKHPYSHIYFAKGGDRSIEENVPEVKICQDNNIDIVLGVGGTDKKESSSRIANRLISLGMVGEVKHFNIDKIPEYLLDE